MRPFVGVACQALLARRQRLDVWVVARRATGRVVGGGVQSAAAHVLVARSTGRYGKLVRLVAALAVGMRGAPLLRGLDLLGMTRVASGPPGVARTGRRCVRLVALIARVLSPEGARGLLRMAVGARSRAILEQFLVEAMVLSTGGGLIGVIAGTAITLVVAIIAQWPMIVSPLAILASVVFSALVGVFFGYYPALTASRLNPIDALRFE